MVNFANFDKETCNSVVSYHVHKVHAPMDGRTGRATAALLYPQRNTLRGDNKAKKKYVCLRSHAEKN